jgi:hypothetical protein
MTSEESFENRVAFAIGTGRCGTHFVAEVMAAEPGVASWHERDPMCDTFHRYCKWYGLPVDDEGFLHHKAAGIRCDVASGRLSFEASSYLTLSVRELHGRFGARFVLMVRRPDEVINSYLGKGWYEKAYVAGDPRKALGYQHGKLPHHFFSRIAPRGENLLSWNGLTRVGKLAWFWNAVNLAALAELGGVPESHRRVQKLEEMDYIGYCDLTRFMGVETALDEARFRRIAESRPGKGPGGRSVADWTHQERAEYESLVEEAADRLGYRWRVRDLRSSAPVQQPRAPRWIPTHLLRSVVRRVRERSDPTP